MQRTHTRSVAAAICAAALLAACGGGGTNPVPSKIVPTTAPSAAPSALPSPAAQSNTASVAVSTTAATTTQLPLTGGIAPTVIVPKATSGSGSLAVTVATGADISARLARVRQASLPGGSYLLEMSFVPNADMTFAAAPGFSLDVTKYVTGAGFTVSEAAAYLQSVSVYAGIEDGSGNFGAVGPLTIQATNSTLTISYSGPPMTLNLKANQQYTIGVHVGPISAPTSGPTSNPTLMPTMNPTSTPTAKPTATPTAKPTATPTAAPTGTPSPAPAAVTTFTVNGVQGGFDTLVQGPDHNMWFTENYAAKIGTITPQGVATTYSLPSGSDHPWSIVSGSDGNLWFSEGYAPTNPGIGRITTSGAIVIYGAGSYSGCQSYPGPLANGPGGKIWFGDACYDVGSFDPANPTGTWTYYSLGSHSATNLVAGSDGNIWYADNSDLTNCLGSVSPSGTVTPVTCPGGNDHPMYMAATPGYVWYASSSAIFEQYDLNAKTFNTLSSTFSSTYSITAGSDGHLWLAGVNGADNLVIGYVDAGGNFVPVPLDGSYHLTPQALAAGPANTLWLISGNNTMAKIDLGSW